MITEARKSQSDFYREFLMGRAVFDPRHHGVGMDREEFIDKLVEEFNDKFRGMLSIDELLLHPRDALRFCDDIRQKYNWIDLPDDIILRSIMQRRKNPAG